MRPSKFTEAEIVQALREVKGGTPAIEVCRTMGVTQTTFYRWRHKYDAAVLNEGREIRALRDENQKLRQIVADLLLERHGAEDVRGRK
jgi:putative transposase